MIFLFDDSNLDSPAIFELIYAMLRVGPKNKQCKYEIIKIIKQMTLQKITKNHFYQMNSLIVNYSVAGESICTGAKINRFSIFLVNV